MRLRARSTILALILFTAISAICQEKVLHSFGNGTDGQEPQAGLIFDAAGNLYGVTTVGGIHRHGTVFELSPREDGGSTEKVLHSFGNGLDGIEPQASLVLDAAGNLYGTTMAGGLHGWGTAFQLSPQEDGTWKEKLLHSFSYYGSDGAAPVAGLIFDDAGNLYGTTNSGGIHSQGAVFELMPRQDGEWTETVLHSFGGRDGAYPSAGLIFDQAGNLYSTTAGGGIHGLPSGCGTVFELAPKDGGGWTETVLHSFNCISGDGYSPEAGLTFDAAGNLYGTTVSGGIHTCEGNSTCGTVFELSPEDGGWREKIVHSFNGTDGESPSAGLTFDTAGNLYGTTVLGGIHTYGTVFELSPKQDGGWQETVVHSFNVNGHDGYNPEASLMIDSFGNLYGTTDYGGIHVAGTVFEITP